MDSVVIYGVVGIVFFVFLFWFFDHAEDMTSVCFVWCVCVNRMFWL